MGFTNILKGAVAQVNPFDGGKTYSYYNNDYNFTGSGGGGWGDSNAQPTATQQTVSAPAPAPTNYDGGGSSYSTGGYTGYGSTPVQSGPTPQQISLINAGFDTKISGLQNQLNTLGSQQDAAQAGVVNQFTTKSNDLQTALATGNRNLDYSTNQVNESKAKSLEDIRRMLNQQMMSYANQLGAFGAGDSSAAGLVNQALSGQSSRNRGNVLDNATDQLTQIDMKRKDLQTTFDTQMRDLNSWRQQSLTDLVSKFMSQKQQIQQAMAQANAERAQQLAQYDASQTQNALNQLANLQAVYTQQANELNNFYQNYFAPQNIQIAPELQQYAVKPIEAGQLAGIGQIQQVTADPLTTMLRKQDEEQANTTLGQTV